MADRINLTTSETAAAFKDGIGQSFGPILLLEDLARLTGIRPKTLREWKAKGRLRGCFCKRGKHLLFWRDRVVKALFNQPEWED